MLFTMLKLHVTRWSETCCHFNFETFATCNILLMCNTTCNTLKVF